MPIPRPINLGKPKKNKQVVKLGYTKKRPSLGARKGYIGIGGGKWKNPDTGQIFKGRNKLVKVNPKGSGKGKGNKGKGNKGGTPRGTPYDPLMPLAGKDFKKELRAGVRAKYAPAESQLRIERGISDQRVRTLPGVYDQYTNQMGQLQSQSVAAYAAAQNQMFAQANAMNQATQAQITADAAEQQRLAGIRGAVADPSVAAKARMAAQGQQASLLQYGGSLGAEGARQGQYLGTRGAIGHLRKAEALGEEFQRRRGIEAKGADLAREKGDYRLEYRNKLREGERTYDLNRKAFGLDVKKAKDDRRHDRQMEKQAAKNQKSLERDRRWNRYMDSKKYKLEVRKYGAAQAKERWERQYKTWVENNNVRKDNMTGGSGSGPSRITPTQRRNYRDEFDKELAKMKSSGSSHAKLLKAAKQRVGGPMAKALADIAKSGYTSPATARAVKRRYGINVRSRGRSSIPGGKI